MLYPKTSPSTVFAFVNSKIYPLTGFWTELVAKINGLKVFTVVPLPFINQLITRALISKYVFRAHGMDLSFNARVKCPTVQFTFI